MNYPPSISVVGAYFPDWLFCWVAGGVLMLLLHDVIKRLNVDGLVPVVALTYPLLTACFSLGVWLVFFPS